MEIRHHPQVKATILQLFDMLSSVFDTFKEHIDLKVTYTKIPAEKACEWKMKIKNKCCKKLSIEYNILE